MNFNEIDNMQRRVLVDLGQAYEGWHAADREFRHSFAGSMRWRKHGDTDYLLRKIGKSEKSLGRRGPETETTFERFSSGRALASERLRGLIAALETQSAIARATRLGRMPSIAARLLREMDSREVLGPIRVVGTNALFAYEALAGVHFSADALATGDIDLLLDARRQLRISVPDDGERTVIGLLRRLDHSFAVVPGKPYRVANADGYMVDLIRPQPRPVWKSEPGTGSLSEDDLSPSPIDGLQWLVNAPSASALVVDDRGYPAPIIVPEPRVWLLHKAWLSQRPLRDPIKKRRDHEQARVMWGLVTRHLPQYPLNDAFAFGLPRPLREAFEALRSDLADPNDSGTMPQPRW